MKIIQGQGVSKGIEQGTIYFYHRAAAQVEMRTGADEQEERARLERAKERTAQQLSDMAEKAREEAGDEAAVLFETHAMFLEDEDYTGAMDELLAQGFNAEYAVDQAGQEFAAMLASMDDPYMQARAADIKDVTGRILNNLMGVVEGGIDSDVPVILCADDLAPSETIQLDKKKILAIATQKGSGNSHTAILARTMGIPAVCGLGEDFNEDFHGKQAYIVGETGQLILEPDEETLLSLKARHAKQEETRELMRSMVGQKDVTLDGKQVNVYCNIGSPEDVASVLANDGQGIGLFRSEFLYLASEDYPTEEEQFRAYKEVAAAMNGKRVIIRTLDIGADKQVDYFHLHKEENPAMGLRAIRICLNRPEVFRTQLRALYRASAYGKIAIMFPMIASVWEVKECRRACQRVMDELTAEGIPFNPDTEIGIMIETPAAVFIADELAQLVDFFSMGTNDLTQYTLACDRQCNDLGKFFDPHHPALLRALKMTADAAHQAGIWIGICGELGADLSLLPTFLAMGIDELSVTPTAVLPLRAAIRKSIAKTCTLELLNS
ncbi:MAG: phosphoenolpyruvate--protein phosphotransferase [Flintibacter sp.]|uniref:phosphoenolpyruvate--protein phosphotransferase n=1 Tax=Flintibacter sp. TaxID=1918624 RepID=UPI0026714CA5|nr:phosphoenolpyruvate--protein phosphotransferase [Flintibacter sp.]MCI6149149.1 phosphoenolpyruvate--protein phosphotransferase [Flintibacter sp.]MDD7116009.1 phosphoenolpyruvate--protein phosphotransferase [Flintibacter sp.]MDY5038606.1 phosphoenolpyruvate--protein phosphotransferase [Lawsonibacter sp.]